MNFRDSVTQITQIITKNTDTTTQISTTSAADTVFWVSQPEEEELMKTKVPQCLHQSQGIIYELGTTPPQSQTFIISSHSCLVSFRRVSILFVCKY